MSILSELEMILSMAETNPGMFNMVANQPEVAKQLEKIGRLKEILMINEEELQTKQRDHWQRWVKQYRYKKIILMNNKFELFSDWIKAKKIFFKWQ